MIFVPDKWSCSPGGPVLGRKTLQFRVEKMMLFPFPAGPRLPWPAKIVIRASRPHGDGPAAGGPAAVAGLCPGCPGCRCAAACPCRAGAPGPLEPAPLSALVLHDAGARQCRVYDGVRIIAQPMQENLCALSFDDGPSANTPQISTSWPHTTSRPPSSCWGGTPSTGPTLCSASMTRATRSASIPIPIPICAISTRRPRASRSAGQRLRTSASRPASCARPTARSTTSP